MIDGICGYCGKTFQYYPSNGPGHFCSRSCSDKGRYGTPEQRFWKRVARTSGCWNWTGSLQVGYGHLRLNDEHHTNVFAHRFSWALHFGPIPDGYFICHHCDNPKCVRPDHLFLGTARDNTQDMIRKGRSKFDPHCPHLKGSQHPNAKLTDADIREIRKLGDRGVPHRAIATKFGTTHTNVGYIVRGVAWQSVQ